MRQKVLIAITIIATIATITVSAFSFAEAAPEGIKSVASANNRFAFDFYSKLKKEKGNIFFSPYSISIAIAMTYEGARGQTAEEMRSVFHLPEEDNLRRAFFAETYNQLNRQDIKYKLQIANALWIQKDYQLLKEYTDIVKRYYNADAINVDFKRAAEKVRHKINSWVEDKTNNKIKDLFQRGSLNSSTRLVLTNAIYFKGNWVKQFNKKMTSQEVFKISGNTTVQVPMMGHAGEEAVFNYTETEELQVLEMLYEGEELSMLVFLPKKDDLKYLEKSLTLKKLDKWKSTLRKQRVDVYMPKFTFRNNRYTLNERLEEMGMHLAFKEGEADFSGIDGTKNLFIQKVVHQAFVDVNEEGTEAAAATGITAVGTSYRIRIPVFRADHPFIFIIQERSTGNILFLGRVIDPTR